MNLPPQFNRWVKSSVNKFFIDRAGDIPMFIEGSVRPKAQAWCECRVDGPYNTALTRNQWKVDIEVNILVVVQHDRNVYQIDDLTGHMSSLFKYCIPVYKLGDWNDDFANNQCKIGDLILKTNPPIRTTLFGKTREDPVTQASVEGHYHGYFGAEKCQHQPLSI